MMRNNRNQDLFEKVRRSRVFFNIVNNFQLDNKVVLDVGCSEGHHLQCFGNGSIGVTIIKEHVQAAKLRGLSVVLKNVEDPNFSLNKKFNALWVNNLFEHLNAPHPFLVRMRDLLEPGGLLILGVPVIPRFSWLTRFKKFRGAYAVSHVNFFTRKTLVETVRAGGWIVTEARLFYMQNPLLDRLFNAIAPHIYVVARPDPHFTYPEKRLRSLKGYE